MRMHSFIKLPSGHLLKAYDHVEDWQVVVISPEGSHVGERWGSVWHEDRKGSLARAYRAGCTLAGQPHATMPDPLVNP